MGYGDELMVSGHVRAMQLKDPRKVRLEYGKPLWNEVFDHNPRIALSGDLDVQVYRPRVNGLRPYCTGKFTDKWVWCDYAPLAGEIYFQRGEVAFAEHFAPDVVIEPNLKSKASPNKDWGRERWARLIQMMRAAGMRPVQLGPVGTQVIPGAEWIETPSFRLAAAILKRARGAVLSEGGMHHAAAAVGLRSVVIFGGYISPRQTGYEMHTNIFTGGKPCGMRIPCKHCKKAMEQITPEMVIGELQALLAAKDQGARMKDHPCEPAREGTT